MQYCNKSLNPFQRRSMQLIGVMMGSSVALGIVFQAVLERSHFSMATHFGIAILAIVPIVGTMIVLARYLGGEKDEYLRNLVVQSILWGFGLVMIADTFLGYVIEYHPIHMPFGLINMDIFVVTALIALEIKLRRNQ